MLAFCNHSNRSFFRRADNKLWRTNIFLHLQLGWNYSFCVQAAPLQTTRRSIHLAQIHEPNSASDIKFGAFVYSKRWLVPNGTLDGTPRNIRRNHVYTCNKPSCFSENSCIVDHIKILTLNMPVLNLP